MSSRIRTLARLAPLCLSLLVAPVMAQDYSGPVPSVPPTPAERGLPEPSADASRIMEQIDRGEIPKNFKFKPLTDIPLALNPVNRERPRDLSPNVFGAPHPVTTWSDTVRDFYWEPSNFSHQPLYFDDVPLERYGQTVCPALQSGISSARFFLTVPTIPYKIAVDHPYDCVTTLGYYRPGACAPCVKEVLPLQFDAAMLETATALAFVFVLP